MSLPPTLKMRTPKIEHSQLKRAFGQLLTFAPAHFLLLLVLSLPGRLIALDLDPVRVGGYDTSGNAYGVAVSGNYAYVTDLYAGLHVIDVSNPANPRRVGGNSGFGASDVVVAGNNVFVGASYDGLVILDLFRPSVRLEPVSPQQPGGFHFLVRGDAGLSVRVQRGANPREWEEWQVLTLGVTPSELSDLEVSTNSRRFYRAVTP
jgi:hypothetical protein